MLPSRQTQTGEKHEAGITPPRHTRWRENLCILLAAIVLVGAGVSAFGDSFKAQFVFDDAPSIMENKAIRQVWPLRSGLLAASRPVCDWTMAVNYSLGKLNPWGYHLVNLSIHLLAALVLLGIIRRTLLLPPLRERFGSAALTLAFAIALLWVVHPLQTESVTYVIQRAESLMGLFYLLTLYCALRGFGEQRRLYWHTAAILCCALGMGTKQVMVSAPLVVLLYDRTFISRSFKEALKRSRLLYVGLALSWGILLWLLLRNGSSGTAGFGVKMVPPLQYALTQLEVITRYLRLVCWPSPLCMDYGGWPRAGSLGAILPPALLIGGLLAGTAWAILRRSAWGFLGGAFFLILAPTSSIMPIADAYFEHRMYLPLAAVVAAVVLGVYELGSGWGRRMPTSPGFPKFWMGVSVALVLSMAGALGYATFLRNRDYRSEEVLWHDTIAQRPEHARPYCELAHVYNREGRYEEALQCADKAVSLYPTYAAAHYSRAKALAAIHRPDEAIQELTLTLSLNPGYAEAYNNRGNAYVRTNRMAEAICDYDEAIALNPELSEAYCNRGTAYLLTDRVAEALQNFDMAIALSPDYAEAYKNRGNAHAATQDMDEAICDYGKAIALKSDYAQAYGDRANAYVLENRLDEAMRDYTRVIAFQPDGANAYLRRGTLHARANRIAEAIRDYDRAIALDPALAEAYQNRGNACAQTNRFAEAMRDYDKAIALKPDMANAYQSRAAVHCMMLEYDKAMADVRSLKKLGAQPSPELLKLLAEGTGRTE